VTPGLAGGVFRLELAPPETLGRRLQYALLSLSEDAEVDPYAGHAVFPSAGSYVELVEEALEALRPLELQAGAAGRRCDGARVRGFDCCRLHRGPSLYSAGRRGTVGGARYAGDYLALAQAGLARCPYTTSQGKQTLAWVHAAVSYADLVLERGAPLGGSASELPWLAKATLFGKLRAPGGGRRPRSGGWGSLDTLGSILLGGSLAFLGSQRLGKQGGSAEFLLVPDAPHPGYAVLRDLLLAGGVSSSAPVRAARLASDYPVSLEVALAVELASELASRLGPASEAAYLLEAARLESAATLVTVSPQQRPLVRGSLPLTTIVYRAFRPGSVRLLLRLARLARGAAAQKALQGLRDLVGGCVNSVFLQAMAGRWGDHLAGCVRGLTAAAQQARRKRLEELAGVMEALASSLAGDYRALARGARA